ncbi:MAG: hypothetical protein ACTHL8_09200 [Burkholderiaceae bacterium]
MPKSLLYVPGLAMPELVVKQARTPSEFTAKVAEAFQGDIYMRDMVPVILGKGAQPRDCRQSLHWIDIPRAPAAKPGHRRSPAITEMPAPKGGASKAFKTLGMPATNVLSLQPGVEAKPMKMSVGMVLTPCTAPEYLAQAMPSGAKTKALADIAAGDTLYIVGHSNAQGGSLTYKCPALGHVVKSDKHPAGCPGWQHAEKRHIDPVTLASLLINEGLPARVQFDIALVACYSAGLDDAELQSVQSFAQRLAGALNGRGCRARVYGATGLTSATTEVQVARGAQKKPDGTILLDPNTREDLPDGGGQPFYKRFFRFYA